MNNNFRFFYLLSALAAIFMLSLLKLSAQEVSDMKAAYDAYQAQDFNVAVERYNKVINKKKDYAAAYYGRGLAYSRLGSYDNAIEDFNEAIKYNPKDTAAYFAKGLTCSSANKYNEAIEAYTKAIELEQNKEYYYSRSIAYSRKDVTEKLPANLENALSDLNKAIEIDRNYANAYYARGVVNKVMGKNEDALKDFNKYIEINGDSDEFGKEAKRLVSDIQELMEKK